MSPQETGSRDPAALEEACAKVSSTHMGSTVTPQSPAANRVQSLYLTHVYFVVYHFFQETLLSLLDFFTKNSCLHTWNCCISSRKINHRGALLHALILRPYSRLIVRLEQGLLLPPNFRKPRLGLMNQTNSSVILRL
jgi:hypothetical protein